MSTFDTDEAFIQSALPAFISEAEEQTTAIETLLLELEEQPGNRELLNSLFRCAHTVKGSAGIFGLHRIVEFAHHVEGLLDKMREGQVVLTPTISTVLLECNDCIKFLVETATDTSADTEGEKNKRTRLVAHLQALGDGKAIAEEKTPEPEPPPVAVASPVEQGAAAQTWTISARFGGETFRNGMDPLAIARYLANLGRVVSMHCMTDTVPPLNTINPETCYLSFTMQLETSRDRDEIEGAFSFVLEDCELNVQAPETPEQKMARAIEDFPETPRLGELLVAVGAVSQDRLSEVLSVQERSKDLPPESKQKIGDLLESQAGVAPALVQAALGKQQKIRSGAPTEEGRYIRVQADRLDAVINLLGELVVAGAGAALQARETRRDSLIESTLQMGRLIEEIRGGTLALRMVPVGETFSRFRRVVRDTAASLGKEVNFEVMGGDSELDKSMVEKIADPLMHLVRNSLDHGLEPPAERIAAGKSRAGTLQLKAHHEKGSILIRIEDDGRGINHERVLQRAWNRGLVEHGVVPSPEQINMLIFEPGFSTAEQVTDLSGRGVGMDVVRRNIEALRGSISLNNQPGVGLQVDIRLPLTLAIIDGFLVGVGRSKFVLPLESVVEVIEAEKRDVAVDGAGSHCVELRGMVLPVIRLRTLYSIETSSSDRVSVVVVNSTYGKFGIEVEVLHGQHQIVIKPLGKLFKSLRGISGSTILGSGKVALILDVNSLGDLVTAGVHRKSGRVINTPNG